MAEWLRAVIAFGSGVVGLSAPYLHPHSTHVVILLPHALFPSTIFPIVHLVVGLSLLVWESRHDLGSVGFSRTGSGRFWSHAGLHSPISRPPCRWLIFTWEIAVRWSLTHRKFLALSTRVFFYGFVHSEAVSFLTG